VPAPRWVLQASAHLLWATRVIDRLYGKVDGLRSRVALARKSDAFAAAYNDIAYGDQDRYRADRSAFQPELYPFERRALSEFFPPPPASVLVGGAGGGREAAALARAGYEIVAFDPARRLVESMARQFSQESIESLVGTYETLPELESLDRPPRVVDLRTRTPFDAAIFGWASFSHIATDTLRVEALRQMATLCRGPVLLSYFPHWADQADETSRRGSFALNVGYFRDLTEPEIRTFVQKAEVEVIAIRHDTGWPYAVLRRPDGL
jgi:SAM-dependent methyltransferase